MANVDTDSCPLCSTHTYLTHRFLGTLICQDCFACTLELNNLKAHHDDEYAAALWTVAVEKLKKDLKPKHISIEYAERNWLRE